MTKQLIFTASDLKDRRTEVLDAAQNGRAIVRAVDGTALVMAPLGTIEQTEMVAHWSLLLRRVERGEGLAELRWLRHLDADDQAEFITEAWEAVEDVAAGEDPLVLRSLIVAWRTTAVALSDPTRREVLLGDANVDDFVAVARPRGRA